MALVSRDVFLDLFVLKGANAIEYIGLKPVRRSVDIDFSLDGSLEDLGTLDALRAEFETLLSSALKEEGLAVFDVKLTERPPNLRKDVLGAFWGGYELRFKVIEAELASALSTDDRRRQSIPLGTGGRREFSVDLSKHEYCGDKTLKEIEGYDIFVYSERMIVCEKIRAICQQMPEYRQLVMSSSGRPRAKDFFDIHYITSELDVKFDCDPFWHTLEQVFAAKRVPLSLLGRIDEERDFHREAFESVRATVRQEIPLKDFDFYVDFLLSRLAPLEARWKV